MSYGNKYQTIETISTWIYKCLKNKYKYDYIESEMYGCCEKFIAEGDVEKGTEKPEFTEKKRKRNKKNRDQVYIIRLSTNVVIPEERKKNNVDGKYIVLAKKDLKGLRSEHIYPRNLLFKEIVEMDSPSIEKIKELINERCKVAYITQEEEALLDKKLTKDALEKLKKEKPEIFKNFNIKEGDTLKERMPEEWEKEENVDIRLKARGIELNPQLYLVAEI